MEKCMIISQVHLIFQLNWERKTIAHATLKSQLRYFPSLNKQCYSNSAEEQVLFRCKNMFAHVKGKTTDSTIL